MSLPALPHGFTVENVWHSASSALHDEVVQFWKNERAIPDAERAKRRAQELLIVSRAADGTIAGVSTARKVYVHQLQLPCFYYRMYIGSTHRTRGLRANDLVRQVFFRSYQILNARFHLGHDIECVGLYVEVESESIKRCRNQTVWTDFGANAVFIGKTQAGHHARVWYFDGSRIG